MLERHLTRPDGGHPAPVKTAPDTAATVRRLLQHSSIELTTNGRAAIEAAARHLPPGCRVYLPKMPRETLLEKLTPMKILRELGLEPVPHIVARHLSGREALDTFARRAVELAGVRRVLIIGGDRRAGDGPFADSAAVIGSGILAAAGITHVDVAGYPDGHPRISPDALSADLELKLRYTAEQDLRLGIVTQFGFDPTAIAAWCRSIARTAPGVPIHAGIAGPTSTSQLLRFARICGVRTSLSAVGKLGADALKLAVNSRPERQLDVMAELQAAGKAGNLAGVHVFSFGGFVSAAAWMDQTLRRAVRTGPGTG